MPRKSTLDAFLSTYAGDDAVKSAVVQAVKAIAAAGRDIQKLISANSFAAPSNPGSSARNSDGDLQQELDIRADEILTDALRRAPVAHYASEELGTAVTLADGKPLAVAIDPLDGSPNIETNAAIGTIFSVLPALDGQPGGASASFLQPGERQLASGFVIYGPQLALVVSVGNGTHIFGFDAQRGAFRQIADMIQIPRQSSEFAINASNYRHWDEAVRIYIDDCLKGEEGPRERNFNMRWVASLVADAYRILVRGGVFLYPGDRRKGYGRGRLRLVYEANPIAFLVEQAGGAATDGVERTLSLVPKSLHERVPLVFGAEREVARIRRYHTEPSLIGERAPLFGTRGLFRA